MLTMWSWIFLLSGVFTALAMAFDVARRPQPMAIMNITWPITGLYMPLVGWWAYCKMGRAAPKAAVAQQDHAGHDQHAQRHHAHADQHDHDHGHHHGDKPKWQSVFVSATHCGGGCTLGDVVTAPIATATGFALLGSTVLGHFALAFVGAYLFGVLFQYLPIRAMGDAGPGQALKDAIKADTLSLIAFQIGMYAWMLIALQGWMGELDAFTAPFWFMMQIAMLIGFATSYPANWILINRGIKHGM
ncbi:DUF4396 domain-containing protein [Salinicola endophyticus]|uniref:DUF4396 domain-containing protein n=1 Tax=Salinicola endophyticus TaxID=1949083 RepID=A0ABY8FCG8_9GAMM|nr:DUF4396 domain-containing protein [Salinicola endophyticus]WFF40460.1 DUF4396 domain-containing protein [Salinicola endophyticus]